MLLAFDLLVLAKCAGLAATGGLEAVHGWVAHVALTGRGIGAPPAQQDQLIRMAYLMLAFWVVGMPPVLYFMQRWTAKLEKSLRLH